MNYMDWAAMGAASSAYAEASRARSENQDLWHQNQMLSNELARLQDQMDQHQDSLDALKNDIARRKAMEEFQAWIEEFIYKFDKTTTEISSGSEDPVYDYGVIASFLDIINTNSLDTSNIRGLENKSAFEQTFLKAQNLFNELEKTPEVQNHLCQLRQLEAARRERERQLEAARRERDELEAKTLREKADIAAEARAQVTRLVLTVGAFLILGFVLVLTYMDYRSSMAEEEKRQWLLAHNAEARKNAEEAKRAEEEKRQALLANKAEEAKAEEEKRQAQEKIDIERATDGNAEAQYSLGDRYYTGKGVSMNYSEALKWYQKAADQGHAKAQYTIGWMYLVGYGVTKDKTLAMKWFKKAADQGDESAKSAILRFQ